MGQTYSDELQKELETLEKPKVTLFEKSFLQTELASVLNMDSKNHCNIAFVGASGVGKSSLINAVRGLRNQVNHGLFAKVGQVECTHEPAKYVYPGHENIVLWDIPGGETARHKAETYFYDQSLDAFDFLIIVVGVKLSEFDTKIAKHAEHDGVPFALVKSKFDQSIPNKIKRSRKTWDEAKAELSWDFKNSFSKDLKQFQLTSEIFIVSEVGFDVQDENFVAYRNDELKLMKMALTISEHRRCNRSQSQLRSTDQHVPMAKVLEPDHPEVDVSLGNLGNAYKSLGETKKAIELLERALVIQEERLGPDYPQVAVTLVNLGNAYYSLGDTKKAIELLERALVIQEEHFGPDHPQVAVTLVNIGSAEILPNKGEEMKRKKNDALTDETDSLSLANDGDVVSKYRAAGSVHQAQPSRMLWSPYPGLNIDPEAIGHGAYASVHIGNYKNKKRAIKKFFDYSQNNVNALNEEFRTISRLKEHQNLVSYVDIVHDNINKALYLIMEFVDGCTLQKYCNPDEKTRRLDLEKKLWISECCWTGLEYLHDNNVLHSDISPNNILVSLDLANVKICDFGLSKSKEEMTKTANSFSHHGTGWFRSPELLQGRRHPIYSDVFSMAATLCEFFSETRLWNFKYDEWLVIWKQQLAKDGLPYEPHCFSKIPENVQNVLRDAISSDYKKRPTSSDVLKRTKTALALEKQKLRKENSC